MKLELVPYGLSNDGDRTHPNHKPKSVMAKSIEKNTRDSYEGLMRLHRDPCWPYFQNMKLHTSFLAIAKLH